MEMTFSEHARRVAYLALAVLALLAWRSGRAEVLSADGLRYTSQARKIAAGDWRGGLIGSVDHPMYPIQIAAVRTLVGLPDSAIGLQDAAWAAAILHGVLLVIPTYLVGRCLFGDSSAWIGTVAFYAVPHTSEILADALSESTFLHFWCWSLFFALSFLKKGHPGWLIGMAIAAAGAYWTRPEGLLICLALGITILVTPLLHSTRVDWPRLGRVLAILALATGALSLPVIMSRGTIGTKPAIAKVLGLKNRSAPHAVERERPLEPGKTEFAIWGDAAAAFYKALRTSTSSPGLVLGIIGLVFVPRSSAASARRILLIGIILSLCALALVRLHATQGYCAPRHTMVPAQILLLAAGHGILRISSRLGRSFAKLPVPGMKQPLRIAPILPFVAIAAWVTTQAGQFARPIGHSALGYKMAGVFLADLTAPDESIVDLSGWASFYAERPGYGFNKLHEITPENPSRFVVVRMAHLVGPWEYCERMRELARNAELIARFPEKPADRTSEVRVYERRTPMVATTSDAGQIRPEASTGSISRSNESPNVRQ